MYLTTRRLTACFVAIVVASSASFSQAQTFELGGTHPDVFGDSVSYTEIIELDNSTDPISTLFFGPGSLGLDGNSLIFAPPADFNATSQNGDLTFLDGRLSTRISSTDGSLFSSVTINESGAVNVFGNALARVDLVGSVVTAAGTFSGADSFVQDAPLSGPADWTTSLTFTFPATDEAILVFDNQLLTAAEAGNLNFAFVDKKVVEVVVPPVIPEPGSLALLAIVGCGGLVRRRRTV